MLKVSLTDRFTTLYFLLTIDIILTDVLLWLFFNFWKDITKNRLSKSILINPLNKINTFIQFFSVEKMIEVMGGFEPP